MRASVGLLLVLATTSAQAADFRFWLGGWNYDLSGQVVNDGDPLDFDRDLDVQPRSQKLYGFAWNTAPGWWPDLAGTYTPIRAGGRNEVDSSITFGPIVLDESSSTVLAEADLRDVDLSLRYPASLGDNTIWAGVTIKRLNGDITVRDESDTEETREPVDQTFPLLHLALDVPVMPWLSLNGSANAIEFEGDKAFEARAEALFKLGPFGLALGWQRKAYDLNTGSYQLDATLQGSYFTVNALLQ